MRKKQPLMRARTIKTEGVLDSQFLEVTNVTKTYRAGAFKRKTAALDSLTIAFPLHKCTGLFGHNGAGKTTLIRLIFGISNPTKGYITLDGTEIEQMDRNRIGYMPEVDKTANVLTPWEILLNHCAIFRVENPRERATTALRRVGLLASKDKKSRELSKGMGRRLAFAQAVIHEPQFLVLDEPFSGLDPLGRAEMHGWINEQKTRGTTIILCSHELKEAYALCDEFNIIRKGRLVYSTINAETEQLVHAYVLKVRAVTVDVLEQLRDDQQLPAWQEVVQEEEQVRVCFAAYEQAAPWLTALGSGGYQIAAFNDGGEQLGSREDLLKFFDLGEQVA